MENFMGILAALGSILFFGSYAVPIKLPHVVDARVDPVVFQFYKSCACFLTSWLLLLYLPFQFTWWGILGGGLWVFNGIGAILGITWAGIGAAQAIWSGLSIFISFIWGTYVFNEPINNQLFSILALILMAIGMVGVALAVWPEFYLNCFPTSYLQSKTNATKEQEGGLLTSFIRKRDTKDASPLDYNATDNEEKEHKLLKGILCAICVGLLNGSCMVPLKYAKKDIAGGAYLLSFGIGAMVITLVFTSLYFALHLFRGKPCPSFQVSKAAIPALTTGLFWSAGNYCSIYATLFLGMALGWPLVQCQVLISASWAVFYFKEANGRAAILFLLGSSLAVVLGAIILSESGSVV